MPTRKQELGHMQLVLDYCRSIVREASSLRGMHAKLERRGTLTPTENRKIRDEADAILGDAAANIPTMQDYLNHGDLNAYLGSLNS